MELNDEKMKPCPFCGDIPQIYEIPPHKHSDWLKQACPDLLDYGGGFFIECGCSVCMSGDSKEGLIKMWNSRAEK